MKRLFPSSLIAFLQENPNCSKADCFALTLPTGTVLYATEGQFDITFQAGGLLNGGFENIGSLPSTLPPLNWLNNSATLSYLSPGQFQGAQSLGVVTTALYGGVSQLISAPWAAGQTFNVSGEFYSIGSCASGVIIHCLDSGGSILSQTGSSTTANNTWQRVSCSIVAPAGTATLRILGVSLSAGSSSFYCDDIRLGTPGWVGPQTTFLSSTNGRWNRGAITSEASFDLKANTMNLTCLPQQNTVYPGTSIGILNAAWNGLFDVAQVQVWTAYMPAGGYGNVSAGIETKWTGYITKINDINRIQVEFECSDPLYIANTIKIPTRLFQPSCPLGFCDSNCTLNAADYTVAFTAKTGSTQFVLTPVTAFTQAAGWGTQGVVTCTAGANKGLSQSVKTHDTSGNLELMNPWLMPVAAGDTFTLLAGCDKSMNACATRVQANGTPINNLIHIEATPYTPMPTTAA